MLCDFSVIYTEQVIIRCVSAAEGSFGYCQSVVAVSQNHIGFVIDHSDSLLCHSSQRLAKTGETVSDCCVVLGIIVAVKVICKVVGVLTAEYNTNPFYQKVFE